MKKTRVVIIGAGHVGSHCCSALAAGRVADEIVLIDCIEEKAGAQARDISDSISFLPSPVKVWAGDYSDCAEADIAVVSVGKSRVPGQTRLQQLDVSIVMAREVAGRLRDSGFKGIVIGITNPADILADCLRKELGFPRERVFSTGTLLDTARLRARIAEYLNISQKNVHAYVFGEHGETSFVPWSIAEVSTINLQDYKQLIRLQNDVMVDLDYEEIDTYMRSSGAKIIARKGCTNYAIAISVCGICECIYGGVNAVVTVSTMLHGEYGVSDVCLSLPAFLGEGKIQGRITPRLTEDEIAKLHISADSLKKVISEMNF